MDGSCLGGKEVNSGLCRILLGAGTEDRADQQEESRHWDDTPVRLRELWSVATSVELSEGQTWPCAAIAVF